MLIYAVYFQTSSDIRVLRVAAHETNRQKQVRLTMTKRGRFRVVKGVVHVSDPYIFLVFSIRPITSTSTRPIFTKFAGLAELWS